MLSPLGAGGMGEVYRARDTRLDRDVALKVLPSHLSSAPALRERFDREARAISKLSHANVCTLFDIGHENGIDYLVMEYLEGETLADRLSKGPLPLEQVVRYGGEIASALDKAHKQGVVHRDLKPGNVMITKAGAKVLDFGLAKYVDAGKSTHAVTELPTQHKPLTQEGTLLGTIPYMAPEQLEGAEADSRTDIFALGALLYEMITGRRAFSGKSRASLIASIMEHEPAPVSSIAPTTPPDLDRVIRTCLAKDPDDRFQSAADVARALKWITEEPPRAATRMRARRVNVPLIALAAIALFATAAALALWLRAGDRKPMVAEIAPPRGLEIAAATISPTGTHIAIVARQEQTFSRTKLYIRSLTSEEPVPIENTDGALGPFWSPDGKQVAFFAEGKLKSVAIAGGTPQTICEARNVRGTWNEEGTILIGDPAGGVKRVSARGGTLTEVTRLDRAKGDLRHSTPAFLPDGEHFLYYLRSANQERAGLWLGSLEKGTIRRLTSADGNGIYDSGYLLFTQRRKLFAQRFDLGAFELEGEPVPISDDLILSAGARSVQISAGNGTLLFQKAEVPLMRQLAWKARDGRELGTLGPVVEMMHFSLSPDGRRVVFEQLNEERMGDLWLLDVGREVVSRLTSDSEWEWAPIWSLDGRRIIFSSSRTDQSDLFEMPIIGGDWKLLISEDGQQGPGGLTPDGRYLIYQSNTGVAQRILGYDLAQRKSFPIAPSSTFMHHSPAVSPDGKWIAYCGVDTGRGEIYAQPFPATGERVQITNTGGLRPVWGPDGRELFYLDHSGMLFAVPMVPEPGKPVPLFQTDFRSVVVRTFFTPMPDGRFLMMKDVSKRVVGPLRMIVNWTEAIEK